MERRDLNKIYHGVDILKLFFAISIVFMHTYCWDMGKMGSVFVKMVSASGVPFFFLCSGFFLKTGLDRNLEKDEKGNYYRKYFERLVKMYLSWTILTLPIAFFIIIKAYPATSIAFRALYWIRMFLLTGSIGVYWYILALIICSFLIFFAEKNNLTLFLFIVSIVFFLWGEFYNSKFNCGQFYFEWIHIAFSSTRNFLNTGLFYIFLGYYISKFSLHCFFIDHKWIIGVMLVLSVLFRMWEISSLNTNYGIVLLSISLFIAALSIESNCSTVYIRRLSIGLYMIHFPFILLFDYYLKKGTLIDFPITLLFVFLVYIIINHILPRKYSLVLLGS